MKDLLTVLPMHLNEEEKKAKRQLRRLRIALIVWLFFLLMTIIWFAISS